MGELKWNQQNMLSVLVSTFFYGMYTIIFGTCSYALVFKKDRSNLHRRLLIVTVALYAFSTVQTVITFWQGFVTTDIFPDGSYGDSYALLHEVNLYNLGECVADAMLACSNLVADGLLIWRCFVLWNRSFFVIAIPFILLLAETACGYAVVAFDVQIFLLRLHAPLDETEPPPGWFRLSRLENGMTITFFSASFITNLLMSSLIALRIWKATRDLGKRRSRYMRVASLILETGVIYSVCLLLCAIFIHMSGRAGTIGWTFMFSVVTQTVGIFPTVIILLVALGRASDSNTEYARERRITTIHFAPALTQPTASGSCEMPAQPSSSGNDSRASAIELELCMLGSEHVLGSEKPQKEVSEHV
ncbi:hypothetical protein NEOLEDRAFT_1130133 [Neolentinus lepideus HHB14362 ss-1]|uniref:Uncharacterized protein n=1 Tax=Neolentinus lepideus HHB14362 ss-1 TaxID=1314782 RepID=A0A165UH07_9AGAM|nr:hypothetical protein NEOLEDRAFT_1130133 [Neolentinus lepideus HHB14362 ss-1]